MKSSYGKLLNPEVKDIAEEYGWKIWSCYNDKCKNHRRLSYARNGWRVPKKSKQAIKKDVVYLLESLEIEGKVYWTESLHYGYGMYDKLCIEVPN